MEGKISIFHQYEFTANDLDSGTCIADVIYVNSLKIDDVETVISNYIKNTHHITTLSGNTWILEDYGPTGKTIEKTVNYKILTQAFTNKIYPIINEL